MKSKNTQIKDTYGVYVVELDEDPCHIYIGQTSHSFEHRLNQHNSGLLENFAAKVFRKGARGRLRPDLYKQYSRRVTQKQAEDLERRLADKLRRRGYKVEGGH